MRWKKNEKNAALENLFEKYAVLQSEKTVGDILVQKFLPPQKPEKTLDLHGFFEKEATEKTKIFLRFAFAQNCIFVRIITGKGTGVLQNAVRKILKEKISQKHIVRFVENEHGFFDIFFE